MGCYSTSCARLVPILVAWCGMPSQASGGGDRGIVELHVRACIAWTTERWAQHASTAAAIALLSYSSMQRSVAGIELAQVVAIAPQRNVYRYPFQREHARHVFESE